MFKGSGSAPSVLHFVIQIIGEQMGRDKQALRRTAHGVGRMAGDPREIKRALTSPFLQKRGKFNESAAAPVNY